jgi:hypothetical protein
MPAWFMFSRQILIVALLPFPPAHDTGSKEMVLLSRNRLRVLQVFRLEKDRSIKTLMGNNLCLFFFFLFVCT